MTARKARPWVIALLVLLGVAACSAPALANPVPIPSLADINSGEMVALLFATNFFFNLLFFSTALQFILTEWGSKAGNIDPNRRKFYASILMSAVFITMVGSVIDATLLYRYHVRWMWLEYDPVKWVIAAALVFLSIFLASTLFMRVHAEYSLIPAGAMTALNVLMWSVLFGYGMPCTCLPMFVLAAILTVLLFYGLGKWHRGQFPDEEKTKFASEQVSK